MQNHYKILRDFEKERNVVFAAETTENDVITLAETSLRTIMQVVLFTERNVFSPLRDENVVLCPGTESQWGGLVGTILVYAPFYKISLKLT